MKTKSVKQLFFCEKNIFHMKGWLVSHTQLQSHPNNPPTPIPAPIIDAHLECDNVQFLRKKEAKRHNLNIKNFIYVCKNHTNNKDDYLQIEESEGKKYSDRNGRNTGTYKEDKIAE